jgi:hypothetical protein
MGILYSVASRHSEKVGPSETSHPTLKDALDELTDVPLIGQPACAELEPLNILLDRIIPLKPEKPSQK